MEPCSQTEVQMLCYGPYSSPELTPQVLMPLPGLPASPVAHPYPRRLYLSQERELSQEHPEESAH